MDQNRLVGSPPPASFGSWNAAFFAAEERDGVRGNVCVELGSIETARASQNAADTGVRESLARIAAELHIISIGVPNSPQVNLHHAAVSPLTPREKVVLAHLAAGERVSTIAKELGISRETVRNHLKHIYGKVGINSQAELIEWARSL